MIEWQKKIVDETGIAFYDSFEAMGGEGSMVEWVNAGLGTKDYGHMNNEGNKKKGEMIAKAIIDAYKKFK
jgi:lysophospholipase L1-like esterase